MEGTGKCPIEERSAISVWFLLAIFEEGAVSVPFSLLTYITPKKHIVHFASVCWLKWKHYSVSALLQMICSAVIITPLSVLSYATSRNQSHKFRSGKRGGQNPCILHCHPKIVYKFAWDVVKVIPSFCGVTLSQYFTLCHTVLSSVAVWWCW